MGSPRRPGLLGRLVPANPVSYCLRGIAATHFHSNGGDLNLTIHHH
jgi:hypothetical protein